MHPARVFFALVTAEVYSYFCNFAVIIMARRLSKKKISGWLLLFAAIIFFCNGGHHKVASAMSGLYNRLTKDEPEETVTEDIPIDSLLTERLASYVSSARRTGSVGIYVWDETAGKEVFAYNADSLMRPASNLKMLTCIAALRRLGPNYCFESGSYMRGTMQDSTLNGDIAFKFDFDPWFDSNSMRRLANAFRSLGIHNLTGSIIVDMAITEPIQHEEHWTIGDLKQRKIGLLHKGERRVMNELKYALRSSGVQFRDSQIVMSPLPDDMRCVEKVSTPMKYSVQRALLNSSNEHAEALLYPLAKQYLHDQDYREAGIKYLNHFIEKQTHLPSDSVSVLHDGCGLCVHNRLSPRYLVRLLQFAYCHKYIYNIVRRYLPVAGESGTLHDRMRREATRGKLQAKTGTLTREDGITSLSGYADGGNGHLLLFSVIQNGMPVYDARIWQDKFCQELVKESED